MNPKLIIKEELVNTTTARFRHHCSAVYSTALSWPSTTTRYRIRNTHMYNVTYEFHHHSLTVVRVIQAEEWLMAPARSAPRVQGGNPPKNAVGLGDAFGETQFRRNCSRRWYRKQEAHVYDLAGEAREVARNSAVATDPAAARHDGRS
jgi:hypothetical protein